MLAEVALEYVGAGVPGTEMPPVFAGKVGRAAGFCAGGTLGAYAGSYGDAGQAPVAGGGTIGWLVNGSAIGASDLQPASPTAIAESNMAPLIRRTPFQRKLPRRSLCFSIAIGLRLEQNR
jgi:hypothetical protein